jgi:hypothetical protein
MNWTSANSGLAKDSVLSIAVDGSNIFAGTSGGSVLHSADNGATWTVVDSGLPKTGITSLAVSGNAIFAGTYSGVWRMPLSEMVGISQTSLSKPLAGGLRISVKDKTIILSPGVMSIDRLTVELFSLDGKRIYSAVHRVYGGILNIPISGLSTGMYLMSITGGTIALSSPFFVAR